jgi:hypothetical protein
MVPDIELMLDARSNEVKAGVLDNRFDKDIKIRMKVPLERQLNQMVQ